ncbi:DUF5694 domain-containing protein [Flavobacterium sp. SM15]|uniref:DUF5694 domain-containing protein n=1 Tax=Flavobacterium sp. SM15 TaxID=2908005 RepID=UPI001EDA777C|nr:DUF5694 domain-containing protein [Flavobacterium sp. SM15]MCG2610724.1 DUF5694 domain-containing protein [Flavobacterium sp. SM15]
MKQHILVVVFLMSSFFTIAQEKAIKSPASFFPKEKAKVLVVGTFHFDYPNLDVKKTEDKHKIDVLKDPKKEEVTQLVNYIKKFKPTKIAIEAFDNWKAFEKLQKYNSGYLRDKRDERIQLGLRIASELKLDTIYSIDAESMDEGLSKIDSAYFKKLFKDFDFQSEDKYNKMFNDWFAYEEQLPQKTNLLNYFKHMNSKEHHKLGYGAYLIGDFKLDDQRGADILSIWWYNRNVRIFRKLQQITTSSSDRVLMIFGNGHAAVLRQLLESSPEYEFIEFDRLK